MSITSPARTSSNAPETPAAQGDLLVNCDRAQGRAWLARLKLAGASKATKLVAVTLWMHAQHHTSRAWPSVSTLAELAGCCERQARLSLRWLEAHALVARLSRGGGRGRTAVYLLACAPVQRGQSATAESSKGGSAVPPKNGREEIKKRASAHAGAAPERQRAPGAPQTGQKIVGPAPLVARVPVALAACAVTAETGQAERRESAPEPQSAEHRIAPPARSFPPSPSELRRKRENYARASEAEVEARRAMLERQREALLLAEGGK